MFVLKSTIIIAGMLLLNACSGSSGTTVTIATESGGVASLAGTYTTVCYPTGGGVTSGLDVIVVSGDVLTMTVTTFTDNLCSAGADESTLTGTIVTGTDSNITGWVDGAGAPVTAPFAFDGLGGTISETAAFTPITLTATLVTNAFTGFPSPYQMFFIVDDTGVIDILYGDNDFDNASTTARTARNLVKL